MKYLLILMIWVPHQPVTIQQIGPFLDLFACERAAGQSLIFTAAHPTLKVETFCAVERSPHLTMPKGKH